MSDVRQQVKLTREDGTGMWITHTWVKLKDLKGHAVTIAGKKWKIAERYAVRDWGNLVIKAPRIKGG